MKKVDIQVKKLHPDAIIPTYGSELAAGFDFYSLEDYTIEPGQTVLIKTGIAMAIPEGYEVQVRPRSGLSLKTKLRVANSPGTIDADYRGECCIICSNTGIETNSYCDANIVIEKGSRIAQGVLSRVPQANFCLVEELDETKRGENGFGSTGKK